MFLLIQVHSVQTFMAHKAATVLSAKLHTRVEIGSLDIQFFKKIVLEDVFIEDLHYDTLLYSKRIKFGIGEFDNEKHKLMFNDIVLLNTKAKLIKYKSEDDLNLQFLIDAFSSKDTTKKKKSSPWDIGFSNVTLVNTDFTYRSEHDTLITSGVNYFDLRTTNVNGSFSDVRIQEDTIFGTIEYLSALEKSGFILSNLSSYVKVSPVGIQMDELKIKTPESTIATDLTFTYNRWLDFTDFINKVKLNAEFNHSHIEMNDISFFAPQLKGLYKNLIVSGKVSGKINDLRGKNMDIFLGGSTHFIGDVTLTGLPKIEETLIYLNVESLSTNYNDLKQIPIPPFDKRQTMDIPFNISKLGNIKFKGTFTGLYNDFYAYGKFSSALGKLSTDLAVSHNQEKDKEFYKGKLKSEDFDFGKFFGANANTLGKVTANVDIDGSGFTLEDVAASLKGTINSLYFNNYSYNNIIIEGNVAQKIFNGKLNVKDENIDFDFIGNVDFTQKLPALDFITTINKADLGALHFLNTTKKTNFSTQLIINVTGNNIDNLNGQINFDNTIYVQDKETYKLSVFNLVSGQKNGLKSIELFSDFCDAKVKGTFRVLDLSLCINNLLNNYLPSYFKKENQKIPLAQNFEYSFLFKKTDAVTRLFIPQLTIAPKTLIEGDFNSSENHFNLKGNSSKLTIYDYVIKNWNINSSTSDKLVLNTGCDKLFLTDSTWLKNFNLVTSTENDSVNLNLTWDNKSLKEYKGDISAFLHFDKNSLIKFKVLPSQFVMADSVWNISKSNEVVIDSNCITIKDFTLEHSNQSIALNGIISENKNDQLKLLLTNFNLANLNLYTNSSGLNFRGTINGESSISNMYTNMLFLSDNTFTSLFVNNNEIGNGSVESIWDNSKDGLYLHGSFTKGIVPNIVFSGNYYPKKEEDNIDMKLDLQAMQMQLFEPFVKEFCSDFKGFFSGNVSINGSLKKPKLSGNINVNAKKITVNYLNTTYNFSHDIIIDNNSFGVENMVIYDVNHNKAVVTGKLYHDNFKNFQLDFDMNTKKFMCLNTTEINNNLYYGKAFVSGIVNIFGFLDNISIDANLKTEKITPKDKSDKLNVLSNVEMTKFYIPLSGPTEVSQNNFITFIKKDSSLVFKNDYKVQLGGLKLNLALDVTPDAEVQLIFDQKVGDIIKSRGNGDIKLEINTQGNFKMFGDYVIESGDYLFTLQNIINKKFDLQKGGTIKWSGIPYKADINLSATYKARAKLSPFFPDDSTKIYNNRYPVDLNLSMTGDLLSPQINFDIGLPTIDASTRQTVLSYVNTEAEVNRQVFSLLILNSFVTPYQLVNAGGGGTVGGAAGSAAGSNTSELLSNQLSNMLSKISKDFDVGVNYRPGDAITKDELELALSTQLFNDKLTIDGNVGTNSKNQNSNTIVGDVNVEYKITDDGKVRIKAFNKANDNNQIYINGPYTQGVGIFYREEFNTIGELYKRYLENLKSRKNKKNIDYGIPGQ